MSPKELLFPKDELLSYLRCADAALASCSRLEPEQVLRHVESLVKWRDALVRRQSDISAEVESLKATLQRLESEATHAEYRGPRLRSPELQRRTTQQLRHAARIKAQEASHQLATCEALLLELPKLIEWMDSLIACVRRDDAMGALQHWVNARGAIGIYESGEDLR